MSRLLVVALLLAGCRGSRPEPHETTLEQVRLVENERAGQLEDLERRIRSLDRDLDLARTRIARAQSRLNFEHAREAEVVGALATKVDLLTRAERDRGAAETALEQARKQTADVQAELERLKALEQRRSALPQELAAAEAALRAEEAKFAAARDVVARRMDSLRRALDTLGALSSAFPTSFGMPLLPDSQPASRPASEPASRPK